MLGVYVADDKNTIRNNYFHDQKVNMRNVIYDIYVGNSARDYFDKPIIKTRKSTPHIIPSMLSTI